MRKERTIRFRFDQLAQSYTTTERLSSSCAASVVKAILNQISPDMLSPILDIGCGDAYLSSLLLDRLESIQCILIDISSAMLERAKQRLLSLQLLGKVLLIRADAGAMPLRSTSIAHVLMAFTIHLLPDPVKTLNGVSLILAPGGNFFLITYDPEDLVDHIYDKYFPKYKETDLQRFVPIPQLTRLLEGSGFMNIVVSKYSYEIRFRNVDEVVHMAKKKPFSAFADYGDKVFTESLEEFELNLRKHFGRGEIVNKSNVTLLSMVKRPE